MNKLNKIRDIVKKYQLGAVICVSKLRGLTNNNYKVETEYQSFVIRLAGEDTNKIINRKDEKTIVMAIKNLSIDAPLIAFNGSNGEKICESIDEADTLSSKRLHDPVILKKIVTLIKHLHAQAPPIEVCFDVFEMVDKYEKAIRELRGYFSEDYIETRDKILSLKDEIKRRYNPSAFSQ